MTALKFFYQMRLASLLHIYILIIYFHFKDISIHNIRDKILIISYKRNFNDIVMTFCAIIYPLY